MVVDSPFLSGILSYGAAPWFCDNNDVSIIFLFLEDSMLDVVGAVYITAKHRNLNRRQWVGVHLDTVVHGDVVVTICWLMQGQRRLSGGRPKISLAVGNVYAAEARACRVIRAVVGI